MSYHSYQSPSHHTFIHISYTFFNFRNYSIILHIYTSIDSSFTSKRGIVIYDQCVNSILKASLQYHHHYTQPFFILHTIHFKSILPPLFFIVISNRISLLSQIVMTKTIHSQILIVHQLLYSLSLIYISILNNNHSYSLLHFHSSNSQQYDFNTNITHYILLLIKQIR